MAKKDIKRNPAAEKIADIQIVMKNFKTTIKIWNDYDL